jgi:hypothetical protein
MHTYMLYSLYFWERYLNRVRTLRNLAKLFIVMNPSPSTVTCQEIDRSKSFHVSKFHGLERDTLLGTWLDNDVTSTSKFLSLANFISLL